MNVQLLFFACHRTVVGLNNTQARPQVFIKISFGQQGPLCQKWGGRKWLNNCIWGRECNTDTSLMKRTECSHARKTFPNTQKTNEKSGSHNMLQNTRSQVCVLVNTVTEIRDVRAACKIKTFRLFLYVGWCLLALTSASEWEKGRGTVWKQLWFHRERITCMAKLKYSYIFSLFLLFFCFGFVLLFKSNCFPTLPHWVHLKSFKLPLSLTKDVLIFG